MEGHGSGGPSLEPRVKQLEHSVESLHTDMGKMSSAIAGISAQVTTLAHTLDSVADKLDVQRTKRPELSAMAAVAAVILAVGGATLWPISQRIGLVEFQQQWQQQIISERGEIIGRFSADRDHIQSEISALRKRVDEMSSDRFTKQDGQRLEDKVDRLK